MSSIRVGTRVAITEICPRMAQRRNVYNQISFTSSHRVMIGHVGIVHSVDVEKNSATVAVYCSMRNAGANKTTQLSLAKTEWPVEALDPQARVYVAVGDTVALSRGTGKVCPGAVTNVEVDERGEFFYTACTKSEPTTVVRIGNSGNSGGLMMLPVYTGAACAFIKRNDNSHSAYNFKSTLHGYAVDTLMQVISNWRDDAMTYIKFVDTIRADPDQVRSPVDGELPLFRAIASNNWPAVVALIAAGANRFAKDSQQRGIVHVAAQRGLDSMLEGVLSLLPKEVNRGTREGDTPLHLAARNAHAACVDRLLSVQHCQPSSQNENGDTPLHEVCALAESANKKATIGRLLVNSRSTIQQPNNNDLTPLQIAILNGHAVTVEQLVQLRPKHRHIETRTGMSPLHFAAACANVNIVNILITLGLEVHKKDKAGRGVLHYVVERWTGQADRDMARLACIQALVHAGAPLNSVDATGSSAIHLLVREMAKDKDQLQSHLVPICFQLVRTSLNLDEMACRLRPRWQLATICFLASKGADVTIKDRQGESAADLSKDTTLRAILSQVSGLKIRSCLPMMSLKSGEFDSTEVTMCTFMCQDSVADVRFMPCGHRVACVDCAQRTAFRRCPLCYHIVASALDNEGVEVEIGSRAGDGERVEKSLISEQVVRKIAEQAAREAKIAVELEKQTELKMLRERLEQLEIETSCSICMDAKITMVFNCGHTACSDCSSKLKQCHICRQSIASFQTIYS